MAKLIQLSQDGRSEHIFDVYSACPLGIKEESKLLYRPNNVFLLEFFFNVFQVREGWNQFGDILF